MPIGKARERWRGHRPRPTPRDPDSTQAYEEGWYALLARQASEGMERPELADGAADLAPRSGAAGSAEVEPEPAPLAEVRPFVTPRPPEDAPTGPAPAPAPRRRAVEAMTPARPEVPSMRIGVRRLAEPEAVYLEYLTASRHRDYFRAELWRTSGPITPVHLWRANHLGAEWDVAAVDRFMDEAAGVAAELIAAAPRGVAPGQAARRLWMTRFLSADWVLAFGVARVSKTVHAMLPELVPDLDEEMTPWARRVWLGLGDAGDDDVATWIETWEAIEDVLVLRGQDLGRIVRRLRRLTPALGPLGRLGPVMAAFWLGYWAEMQVRPSATEAPAPSPEPEPIARTKAKAPRKRRAVTTADAPVAEPPAATGRTRSPAKPASRARASTAKRAITTTARTKSATTGRARSTPKPEGGTA